MIIQAIILSLQITAVYILFQEGMLLGWFRIMVANFLDNNAIAACKRLKVKTPMKKGMAMSEYIQKPIWGCVICMAGIWTIAFTRSLNFPLIFVVCGINVLIDKIINNEGSA